MSQDKGSGTVSFDSTTGKYLLTYTAGVTSPETKTATLSTTADSLTFESRMYYGSASMNVMDEDGNFLPYTAKKVELEIPVEHTVTATAGTNGAISPAGDVIVNDGADVEFTFTPNTDYEIDTVTVDGAVVVPVDGKFTITGVSDNMTINVTFKAIVDEEIGDGETPLNPGDNSNEGDNNEGNGNEGDSNEGDINQGNSNEGNSNENQDEEQLEDDETPLEDTLPDTGGILAIPSSLLLAGLMAMASKKRKNNSDEI